MAIFIKVISEDFNFGDELSALRATNTGIGAIVSFLGTVRDMNRGEVVTQMALEHYPGMTEKSLQTIGEQAMARWQIEDALVIHRYGALQPGDQIVLVAVTSAHRGEAFQACEFIIDYLKTEAPFWKKESTPSGSHWVDARDTDQTALQKWQTQKDEDGSTTTS
ncbi:molybdopterin synthase catalytic subunit MoaE [Ampullimonas aquatilis]|uniref:molybdopterin synthase catalytic subunit MoaE n=1 Tax=Ampullimonas aquatilis TaxID=1341549 RepID=UPI003C760F28